MSSTRLARILLLPIAALTFAAWTTMAPSANAYPEGFYIGLGVGGAVVDGERGVQLTPGTGCTSQNQPFLWREPDANRCVYARSQDEFEEISRTDFGAGLNLQFRLGYNIMGHASVEASAHGHGSTDFKSGAGYANFQVRWHFLKLFELAELLDASRAYDLDLMVGVGYSIGGYTPTQNAAGITGDDEKGWEGLNVTTGVSFNYQVADAVSLGLELKFAFRIFNEFIANWDKSYRSEPADGAGGMAFLPTFNITFHP